MASNDWNSFASTLASTTSSKVPAKKAAVGKTPRDKMLANYDAQLAHFNGGKQHPTKMAAAKSWFKDNDGEVAVQVRFAGKPIKLLNGADTLYVERKNLKNFSKALRQAIVDGEFEAEIADLEKELAKRITTRKATRAANAAKK